MELCLFIEENIKENNRQGDDYGCCHPKFTAQTCCWQLVNTVVDCFQSLSESGEKLASLTVLASLTKYDRYAHPSRRDPAEQEGR
jgi:hypothetical protein